jgi:hypothetical protein
MYKFTGKDTSHHISLIYTTVTHSLVAEYRWVEGLMGESTEHEAFIIMCSNTKIILRMFMNYFRISHSSLIPNMG